MAHELLVITGPTATGKSELSIRLAKELDGEIVSADSMQVYRGMDIGTAKLTHEQMQGVPHHMIDVAEPDESFSVAKYAQLAGECIEEIFNRGRRAILAGGTGLYIDAVISGAGFAHGPQDSSVRERLNEQYDNVGGEEMLLKLSAADPESGGRLHPNDKKRIVRAMEVFELTGRTISQHNKKTKGIPNRYDAKILALSFSDRADLYERIDRRVDIMMESGLLGEVQGLLERGIDGRYTSMQAIGYKELAAALEGQYSTEIAVEQIKTASRRYAKRQLSWIRRRYDVKWHLWGKEPDFDCAMRVSTEFFR